MNQKAFFVLAIFMMPVIVVSGIVVKMCQLWLQSHDNEPALGGVWQIAVSAAAIRAIAAVAELYALVQMIVS